MSTPINAKKVFNSQFMVITKYDTGILQSFTSINFIIFLLSNFTVSSNSRVQTINP